MKQKRKFKRGEYRLTDTAYNILYSLYALMFGITTTWIELIYLKSLFSSTSSDEYTVWIVSFLTLGVAWHFLVLAMVWSKEPPLSNNSLIGISILFPRICLVILRKITNILVEKVE